MSCLSEREFKLHSLPPSRGLEIRNSSRVRLCAESRVLPRTLSDALPSDRYSSFRDSASWKMFTVNNTYHGWKHQIYTSLCNKSVISFNNTNAMLIQNFTLKYWLLKYIVNNSALFYNIHIFCSSGPYRLLIQFLKIIMLTCLIEFSVDGWIFTIKSFESLCD